MQIVTSDLEGEFDGMIFEPFVVGLAVQIAGAFIEQIRDEIGRTGYVGLVLGRSTMKRVIQRDQRHRFFANEPSLDTRGADDFFDRHCRCRARTGSKRRHDQKKRHKPVHDRFSARTLTSLIK